MHTNQTNRRFYVWILWVVGLKGLNFRFWKAPTGLKVWNTCFLPSRTQTNKNPNDHHLLPPMPHQILMFTLLQSTKTKYQVIIKHAALKQFRNIWLTLLHILWWQIIQNFAAQLPTKLHLLVILCEDENTFVHSGNKEALTILLVLGNYCTPWICFVCLLILYLVCKTENFLQLFWN